jgi:diaminopimelate epimerase
MKYEFWKFQGNGNDFVILDGRLHHPELSNTQIKLICDRHFGVGADGLMILADDPHSDFEMIYYNADGHLSSMCGNGGRCIAAYAYMMKVTGEKTKFKAFDGIHKAHINNEITKDKSFDVSLSMNDISNVIKENDFYLINSGSPHYVEFVKKVAEIDVVKEGKKTRFSERFSPEGINVNFVEISDNRIFVRTYERGVEDETLSCGTGVTASAIAAYLETGKKEFSIHTTGGEFSVNFEEENSRFSSVWLNGPAELVFNGTINI